MDTSGALQTGRRLVLASASEARRSLLANAGLRFDVCPANIDEEAIREAILKDTAVTPADLAQILAEAKADALDGDILDAMVIGSDQTLEFDGRLISKAPTIDDARRQLLAMRGKSHQLHSAATLMRAGSVIWRHVESVTVTLRSFSPEFLGHYLAHIGDAACQSVGGYQIEGAGAQLIERIEGDYFAVLGLPLLPLLQALRENGALER